MFVFALFNLQGTSALAVANLAIIASNFSFVKYFFQILANFFSNLFFVTRSPERSHIIALPPPFVNTFFPFFPTYFFIPQLVAKHILLPQNVVTASPPAVQFAQPATFDFFDPVVLGANLCSLPLLISCAIIPVQTGFRRTRPSYEVFLNAPTEQSSLPPHRSPPPQSHRSPERIAIFSLLLPNLGLGVQNR